MRLLATAIALATAVLGFSAAHAAGPYDPAVEWTTLESERFMVHYPDGARNLAVRISRMAEAELDSTCALFGYEPDQPIEIILTDAFDTANGSARTAPRPILVLRLTAPTELTGLSSYDDWLRILLVHEIAHICDIDQTYGVTRVLDWLVGPYVRMNSYTPQFLTEGVAVYAETLLSDTGRGRSSYVDMLLRTAALEGQFVDIDQANLAYSEWPGGGAAYFYGGHFHLWLAERYGEDAVRELHSFNAAIPIPYLYWPGAKAVFGKSLPTLWDDWRAEEVAYARAVAAKVRREGETQSRAITTHGRNITGTRYHPSGKFIIYSRSSPVDGSTVRKVNRDGSDDEWIVLETFSPRFSFSPDGEGFYMSQYAINDRFTNYSDIYRFDLDSEELTRMKDVGAPDRQLRARDPDAAPDGKNLVFVQNEMHQSWVSIGTFVDEERTQMEIRTLVPPQGDNQHAQPRFSPDSSMVAVSSWLPGGYRDLFIVDALTGEVLRRVTYDRAQDGNPAWSRDGRYLLYESDATGISNIYAYAWEQRRYFRVTNMVGGAFQPDVSPDGEHMVFRNASARGFDIHEMSFDPASFVPVQYDPAYGYRPTPNPVSPRDAGWIPQSWTQARPRDEEPPITLREGEEERDYFPAGLVPFNDNWFLIPSVFVNGDDPTFRLSTGLVDTLGEHGFSASVGSSVYTGVPSWSVGYSNDTWYPTFSLGVSDVSTAFNSARGHVARRALSVSASMSLPIFLRHLVGVSYIFQRREPRDALSAELLELEASENFARLQFGYAYQRTRSYPYSVGREQGFSVSLSGRIYSQALGASFDEVMTFFDVRGYINNPWLDNHVLALRTTGAFAFGPDFRERFALGGAQSTSFFTTQPAQTIPLRGFALDVDRYRLGTNVLAAYAEYRFPIWQIEAGLWTLPVFFDKLHAGVFVEGGNTFGNGEEEDVGEVFEKLWRRMLGGRLGMGAEIRLDVTLGWAFPLSFRLGLATPAIERGRWSFREVVPYFAFGTAI